MDRRSEIDERYFRSSPRSPLGYRTEEYERRRPARSPSPAHRIHTEEFIERRSPAPGFIEEDRIRREREARGVLVRRQEVERRQEIERRRSPSPSAAPPRGILRRVKSVSPSRESEVEERIRHEEIIERRSQRGRSRSRSPSMESRLRNRFHDRRRSLDEHERVEMRMVKERRVARSPSSSRSSSPSVRAPVVRGPTIERDVITHYHDVDHGVTPARVPQFNHVSSATVRARSKSRERRAPRFASQLDLLSPDFEELRITDTTIDDNHGREHEHMVSTTSQHRRAHSAAPLSPGDREEAEYITNRIDSRGRMGEAKNGITKEWNILDVPPGTERVRMDGAGGAGVDVDWTQYSGVRRTRFVPDRDRDDDGGNDDELLFQQRTTTTTTDISPSPPPRFEKEREVHIEKITDRKVLRPGPPPMPPPPRRPDMWTEITKDLVCREALDALRYDYEETDWHFYVMQYLQYEDVLELIELSDDLRRRRRDRAATWDRMGRWEREHKVRPPRGMGFEEDRVVEKKVYYERPERSGGMRYHR